jgi:hypothetical protein
VVWAAVGVAAAVADWVAAVLGVAVVVGDADGVAEAEGVGVGVDVAQEVGVGDGESAAQAGLATATMAAPRTPATAARILELRIDPFSLAGRAAAFVISAWPLLAGLDGASPLMCAVAGRNGTNMAKRVPDPGVELARALGEGFFRRRLARVR